MKKPSLALIPSGYKASKVYSILPNNGDGDFAFSRGSGATRVNKDGFIETVLDNVPRLDYSDGGCPSLLLEPQRTNLVPYSEDFSNAAWAKGNVDISTADIVSPSGELNATKMTSTGTGTIRIFDAVSTSFSVKGIIGPKPVPPPTTITVPFEETNPFPKGPRTPIISPFFFALRALLASPTPFTVIEVIPSQVIPERLMGISSTPGIQTITN